MGEGVAMRLTLPPLTFEASFGVDAPHDAVASPYDDEVEDSETGGDDEGGDEEPDDLDDDE
jgi:hypothetical protein